MLSRLFPGILSNPMSTIWTSFVKVGSSPSSLVALCLSKNTFLMIPSCDAGLVSNCIFSLSDISERPSVVVVQVNFSLKCCARSLWEDQCLRIFRTPRLHAASVNQCLQTAGKGFEYYRQPQSFSPPYPPLIAVTSHFSVNMARAIPIPVSQFQRGSSLLKGP